ncbi:hypothetical protein TREMEDRAFT_11831, partial [Tremella mesenterica DSM 1558]|uniref:uncharacterized protein n=1 Tax=Tremella mesenterica (strain ATCC 24925 / CBS 8224 / DSM 1558 / NBRC 9311 / NRRL Y-6157 / RJB 2259-6 / UBC 559-6) TaxID=578456 RepID=UPI0003F49826
STGLGQLTGCGCDDGWTGLGCTVCQSSKACTSSLSSYLNTTQTSSALNTSLTCSNVPTVYSSSQMSCSVIQPLLQSLFPGQTYLSMTRSLNSSLTPGGTNVLEKVGLTNGDNQLWAQVWYNGTEQFYCFANECDQDISQMDGKGNSSKWTCPNLKCVCRPGTTFCGGGEVRLNITGAIDILSGPLVVDCSDDGQCTFQQSLLKSLFGANGLQLSSCSYGECVEQYIIDQSLGLSPTSQTISGGLSGGVIAGLAVVGIIVFLILLLVIWGVISRYRARRNLLVGGNIPKSGGVGIKWFEIGYEVKPSSSKITSRTLSWIKGSGRIRRDEEENTHLTASRKIILQNVSGQLPPGGFCCILGPSGAGKSTLIDILAGKRKTGQVTGRVQFSNSDGRKIKIGYVDQSDVLSPTSTVLETLLFAAHLRLPENIPKDIKDRRAQTVLEQLNMTDIAHTRIGSIESRGISGGEMRRVSIGIELVSNPDVLILDEPTSGLDSVSAYRLINLLKNLSEDKENETTIIASIHQPSSALYHSFTQVCLLSKGKQLYFGQGGNAPAEFFAGKGKPCPQGYNIADHLLDLASGQMDGLSLGSSIMAGSILGSEIEREVDNGDSSTVGNERRWWPEEHCATSFLTQIEVLSGREWKNLKRDKTLLIAHISLACILGVFAGGLYYKVSLTIAGFQNRIGSLFFLGSLIAFSSLSALYNLVEVRGLFLRERSGGFYTSQAWLLSRIISDLIPLRLVPTIIVGVIVYFMVGLAHEATRFFKFLLILVEFSLAMTLWNFLLACLFRHGGVAILLSSLCNLFLMTYAGFFVNIEQIPPVLRWLRYFSTLGYTLEALSVNEVGSGLQIIDTLGGVPIQISAELIMSTLFGFDLKHYYRNVLVLFAFIAGFGVLLILTVVYILRERR